MHESEKLSVFSEIHQTLIMNSLICLLFVLPCTFSQIPGLSGLSELLGLGGGGFQQGVAGGGIQGFPGSQGYLGGERSYYVRGRLLCGILGAEGARVSLWENRGGGSPVVYEEAVVDASGTFYVKAEILNGGVWNPLTPYGYLSLTISHNCQGQRHMVVELPTSYFNQGIGEIKTFDLGTINLEGRFPCEGTSNFLGGGGPAGFGGGIGSGFAGSIGGAPVQI